jgi:hypothetical protein
MFKSAFRLNQTHWKYTVRTTNGLNEERLYEDTDEELYVDAFESDDFEEISDNLSTDSFSTAA